MESFQIIEPSATLAPYVKQYWFLEIDHIAGAPQRIIPSGFVNMVFHRGKRMFSVQENSLQPRFFIGGQNTGYYDLVQTGNIDMICVLFRPHMAKAFFGLPIYELNEKIIPAGNLEDTALNELGERLYNTTDRYICTQLIEAFLTKRLSLSKEYNFDRMAAVVQSINTGQTDIATLARTSCLSYKQFKRIFTEYVGTNPKDFLRIVRFQKALYLLQNNTHTFAQLTYLCGYSDQSHMIREFKLFSGYTPGEYISICAPYSDYFS